MPTTGLPGLFALTVALALVGCGDDSTPSESTSGNGSTGSGTMTPADDGGTSPGTTGSSGATAEDADGSSTQATDATAGSSDSGSGSGSDSSSGDSGSGSGDSSGSESGDSSSSGGATIPGCEICEDDEVCVVNQSFMNTYECHPAPKACEGDVDCECGLQLCVDPFVGCFDPPEQDTLFCACLAC